MYDHWLIFTDAFYNAMAMTVNVLTMDRIQLDFRYSTTTHWPNGIVADERMPRESSKVTPIDTKIWVYVFVAFFIGNLCALAILSISMESPMRWRSALHQGRVRGLKLSRKVILVEWPTEDTAEKELQSVYDVVKKRIGRRGEYKPLISILRAEDSKSYVVKIVFYNDTPLCASLVSALSSCVPGMTWDCSTVGINQLLLTLRFRIGESVKDSTQMSRDNNIVSILQ